MDVLSLTTACISSESYIQFEVRLIEHKLGLHDFLLRVLNLRTHLRDAAVELAQQMDRLEVVLVLGQELLCDASVLVPSQFH